MEKKDYVIIRIIEVILAAFMIAAFVAIVIAIKTMGNKLEQQGTEPIVIIRDYNNTLADKNISRDELIQYIDDKFYICPECGSPMYLFSSSGSSAASAQFKCYECEYNSTEIYKEGPIGGGGGDVLEQQCREECIKHFRDLYPSSFDIIAIQIADNKGVD